MGRSHNRMDTHTLFHIDINEHERHRPTAPNAPPTPVLKEQLQTKQTKKKKLDWLGIKSRLSDGNTRKFKRIARVKCMEPSLRMKQTQNQGHEKSSAVSFQTKREHIG